MPDRGERVLSVLTRIASLRPAASTASLGQSLFPERASPAALLLLGEVLARLAGVERPVLQIVAACAAGDAGPVARDFAAAAATRFGRTLLVSSTPSGEPEQAGLRGLSWLMSGTLGGEPDGITPDTAVPGLYYTSLALHQPGPLDVPVASWLAGPQAFRMIVIESPAIAADPRTLAVSALCHGGVLSVSAGATTLAELRTATRQLASAGVALLGTVLQDAPRIGRSPRRRAG